MSNTLNNTVRLALHDFIENKLSDPSYVVDYISLMTDIENTMKEHLDAWEDETLEETIDRHWDNLGEDIDISHF